MSTDLYNQRWGTKLSCCGHDTTRHELLANGNGNADGTHVCLTGFCFCGMERLKKHFMRRKLDAPKKVKPQTKGAQAYRQYRQTRTESGDDE